MMKAEQTEERKALRSSAMRLLEMLVVQAPQDKVEQVLLILEHDIKAWRGSEQ